MLAIGAWLLKGRWSLPSDSPPFTQLLRQARGGDQQAARDLWPWVYGELRSIAVRMLHAERPAHTLQPTALVNEAYLRLVGQKAGWQDRAHFVAIAAQAMRRILVDYARAHRASKRGDGTPPVAIEGFDLAGPDNFAIEDMLAVDAVLQDLDRLDHLEATIVELRYFGGSTIEETAEALGVSPATVKREWTLAKAWLFRRLSGGTESAG